MERALRDIVPGSYCARRSSSGDSADCWFFSVSLWLHVRDTLICIVEERGRSKENTMQSILLTADVVKRAFQTRREKRKNPGDKKKRSVVTGATQT